MIHPRASRWFSFEAARRALLLACLLAPSVWMLVSIPPLWRDADAYVQLTQNPLVSTFWGHAPAYCYLAKVPLFIGEQWERWRGVLPSTAALSKPALTDTGIWLLIVAQHAAMCLAAYWFICVAARRFWVRLVLAAGWASNALFYTFAQCVGSETLGMITILLVAAQGLRIIRTERQASWKEWYFFAVTLVVCILSRDLNLALLGLLPASCLLAWALGKLRRRTPGESGAIPLRRLVAATAVGLACVVVAHQIPRAFARKTHLHPHSRLGFTFLWRLHSLSDLSQESRHVLLERVKARAESREVRELIELLETQTQQGDPVNHQVFVVKAVSIVGGPPHWLELDRTLNKMAMTFLWPPNPELVQASRTDFFSAIRFPSTVISRYLFDTTCYYFEHREELPACAGLITFRGDATPDQIKELPNKHAYFQFWARLTYVEMLFIWLAALLIYVTLAARISVTWVWRAAYSIGLVLTGIVTFAVACLLHDYEPRFSLTMWELMFLSLIVIAGAVEAMLAGRSPEREEEVRRAAVRPEP